MTDLTETLREIRERAEAATEGPWEVKEKFAMTSVRTQDPTARLGFRLVAQVPLRVEDTSDAEFIAHARTDVPRLVEALEAVLKALDHAATAELDTGTRYITAYREGRADAFEAAELLVQKAITEALTTKEGAS